MTAKMRENRLKEKETKCASNSAIIHQNSTGSSDKTIGLILMFIGLRIMFLIKNVCPTHSSDDVVHLHRYAKWLHIR
jgi:hypothetical protein